ncbi:MAG: hypothetical protein ISR65_08645 [Bacteriovoracaceae bacterium]|nr:hypothetical protein [Bacteriovoracaceae bacterium]
MPNTSMPHIRNDASDEEFRNEMIKHIKKSFGTLLNEEDLRELENGAEGLAKIAKKYQKAHPEKPRTLH